MYRINKRDNYIKRLLEQGEQIFHTQDLAILWDISNTNTLYTTIKRYCQREILHRIYKGMYSTVPLKELDAVRLGIKALHSFAYVSCETILQKFGLINPIIQPITFVSDFSKVFRIGSYVYRSRKLKNKFLFHPAGIKEKHGVQWAEKERAIADMLYFNRLVHFDGPVDWRKIKIMQKTIGYPLTHERYAFASS